MGELNKNYSLDDNWFLQRIFKGLKEDVNLLYRNYLETDLRFSSFAKLWRGMKFLSIFGERYLPAEVMEYTEGVLHFSKSYIFSHEIKAVVFGIYFAYAVYSKQPMKGKITKLRLTLTEFKRMKDNFRLLREQGYEDAAEIFIYMFRSYAFLYVASVMQGGIEQGCRKYFKGPGYNELQPRVMTDPFDRNLLDSYENVVDLYREKKREAFGNCDEFDEKLDFLEEMKKQLNHFGRSVASETLEPVAEPVQTVTDRQGSVRKELKIKSFKDGAVPASTSRPPPQPVVAQNVKRKKQIKIEFQAEPAADVEEEPIEDFKMSFDLNVFD